jgi:hypothetical protein
MALFKICLADSLQDATDCGGLGHNINFGITQGIACYVDFAIGDTMDVP